jgi:protein-S-isoprenylcysteine O-methyltransferase Ste14
MSVAWFNGLLISWCGLALVSFVSLFWRPAPYGRYFEPGWGPPLAPRDAWFLMETPAVLVLPAWFLASDRIADRGAQVFVLIWLLHYVHRAWVYPFRRKAGRPMPLALALCAATFNILNGSFNGGWLFHIGPAYPDGWLKRPEFLVGTLVFLAGLAINLHSDTVLIRLRRNGDSYRTPVGGLFRFVSCPHYLGEIIEWVGWAVLTWSWAGLSFALWTAANLAPRALTHHRHYRETIDSYPRERKALLPFVY